MKFKGKEEVTFFIQHHDVNNDLHKQHLEPGRSRISPGQKQFLGSIFNYFFIISNENFEII